MTDQNIQEKMDPVHDTHVRHKQHVNSLLKKAVHNTEKELANHKVADKPTGHPLLDKMRDIGRDYHAKTAKHLDHLKKQVKEDVEQIDELSNSTLTNYKKAAASAPIAKGGDTTAGRILATARKRQQGVQAATKRLDERAEGLSEGVVDTVKGLFGASKAQKASRAHAERAARAAAVRHADRKEKERQSSKPTGDVWGHHADTTIKKGAKVHEEVETVEEAVKIPAHDEMCGDIGQAPKTAEHVKLSTKGQLKMLAMVQKAKYASHTNVEVPGTQVKEEVEQIEELSKGTLGSYVKKASSAAAHAAKGEGGSDDHLKPHYAADKTKRLAGVAKAVTKITKEEVEQIDELSNEKLGAYKKAAGADATAADKAGNFARGNKRFSGIVKATKKQFANDVKKENVLISFKDFIKEGSISEAFVFEAEELSEEFISHSDFESKLANHKNSGMVVHHDYDHKAKKAVIRHVDHEGEVREFHYHEKGTTVQRLAPKKRPSEKAASSAPAEKRGRGRPAGKYGSYKKNK